jgi:phosphatidylglycerol:prolipoprotein diacylglycerol transferase
VAGILGAKLSQLLAEGWPVRVPWFTVLEPQVGGRALLGGVIFGWIGVEIAKRRMGLRRSTGDLFALALPAGEAVGRIGCHLNGCCYGVPCDLPWAIYQHGAWRQPAQLVSSVVAALTFGFLLWLAPKLHREGQLFQVYLLVFGVTRFGLEFVRWRESTIGGLSPMQWFCLDLIVFASVALSRRRRHEMQELRQGI